MVVNPSVPAKTTPEFIALAKADQGKVSMASGGNKSTPHVAGELFEMMAGIDMVHVPYRAAGPAITELLGGQAQGKLMRAISRAGRKPHWPSSILTVAAQAMQCERSHSKLDQCPPCMQYVEHRALQLASRCSHLLLHF
jgi:tripartite-type tricarboxylate transporter receptor subunit TctC